MISDQTDNTATDAHDDHDDHDESPAWDAQYSRLNGDGGGFRLRLVLPLAGDVDADVPEPASGDDGGGPFALTWRGYRAGGFSAPIPLPAGEKHPPPKREGDVQYTGDHGQPATVEKLFEWQNCPKYRQANIAISFCTTITIAGVEYQLVGIDVDAYGDKHGGDQLKALETDLEPLPDTWTSSSRTDGHSGIRWFLVPLYDEHRKRIDFRAKADSAIDVIQRKHRYAVVWPSRHPDGGVYWWFPPGVDPDNNGRGAWNAGDALPVLTDLPVLPNSWVTYLREHRSHSGEIDLDISVTDLFDWTDDAFNDGKAVEICWNMAAAAETFKTKITDDESSHDKITDAHWLLFSLAAEGHTGWHAAVEVVEKHWLRTVLKGGKRGLVHRIHYYY